MEIIENPAVISTPGEITDPAELDKYWNGYIYPALDTVYKTKNFASVKEIDPNDIVDYCFAKYLSENGAAGLESVDSNESWKIFPLPIALEYAQRYFNVDDLDEEKLSKDSYNSVRQEFYLYTNQEDQIPSYSDFTGATQLKKITGNGDGTVSVLLANYYEDSANSYVNWTETYTLQQRPDGSLYFVSGAQDYVNNNLVKIAGDYQYFEQIEGWDGDCGSLFQVGELNSNLILGQNSRLLAVNPQNLTVEKVLSFDNEKFMFSYSLNPAHVRQVDDRLIVTLEEKVVVVNPNLEIAQVIPLPEVIKEKNKAEDSKFGGYDIAADLATFAFTDKEGVSLVDQDNPQGKLVTKINSLDGQEFNYFYPEFLDNDQRIMTERAAYASDWSWGYTLVNLQDGTAKDIPFGSMCRMLYLYYDSGMIINGPEYPAANALYETYILDYQTGNLEKAPISEDLSSNGIMFRNSLLFFGQSNLGDLAARKYTLNSLEFNGIMLKRLNFSVTAAEPHIIAILADGRLILSYELNPAEKGVCIINNWQQ